MKKQNANNKLAFTKAAVTELNDKQLNDINGASTPFLPIVSLVTITITIMEN